MEYGVYGECPLYPLLMKLERKPKKQKGYTSETTITGNAFTLLIFHIKKKFSYVVFFENAQNYGRSDKAKLRKKGLALSFNMT